MYMQGMWIQHYSPGSNVYMWNLDMQPTSLIQDLGYGKSYLISVQGMRVAKVTKMYRIGLLCVVSSKGKEMSCGVVTVKWLGNLERIDEGDNEYTGIEQMTEVCKY